MAGFESGFEPTDSLPPDPQPPEDCPICMNDLGHCCQHDGECAEVHPGVDRPCSACGAPIGPCYVTPCCPACAEDGLHPMATTETAERDA